MITIRQATRDDAFILGALTLQEGVAAGGVKRAGFITEYADAWLAQCEDMPTWIAFGDDGSAIGFVQTTLVRKLPSLRRATTNWIHVKNVFVIEPARGQKVAERMLTEMIAWGDENGVERYQLNAAPKARSLYERLGFGAPHERLMERRRSWPVGLGGL
ncbi:GNAT family N-acetyltransferase [Calidifontibacter indicus]|uniref:GNAT family N-acetyltransferase n=1 Tax=Calidifontibacter indicus TaxID=419650 RepID=UPI003D735D71